MGRHGAVPANLEMIFQHSHICTFCDIIKPPILLQYLRLLFITPYTLTLNDNIFANLETVRAIKSAHDALLSVPYLLHLHTNRT